jgi:hypothetical protein
MANFSVIIELVPQIFEVIDLVLEGFINLLVGNLLILTFVGLMIGLLVTIFVVISRQVKKTTNGAINMKNK